MKIALWIVFALIAALWTGTVLVSAELTGWLATTMASGQAGDVITNAGQWPVPAWLGLLVDAAWIEGLQAAWVDVMGWFGQSGPALGGVAEWSPMIAACAVFISARVLPCHVHWPASCPAAAMVDAARFLMKSMLSLMVVLI